MVILNQIAQAGEEGVAVAQMTDSASVPVGKGLVGPACRRRRVPLEHLHAPTRPRERQGRKQAGHAGADHENALVVHRLTWPQVERLWRGRRSGTSMTRGQDRVFRFNAT